MTSLSIIIPATDRRETLGRVVESIRRAEAAPEELIIVDEPPELGASAARNLGAQRAAGEVLVFVDSDVEVHPDVFFRIRRAFEANELTAIFGSYDDDPERHGVVSDFRNLLHHHVHHEGAGEATTFWTGLGAVRREAFLAVGGFDESLTHLEDVDLGMRLCKQGARIRLDPTIQGKHLKAWTLPNMVYTDLFGRGIPWIRLLARDPSNTSTLNLGWRHRASAVASLVLVAGLLTRRPRLVGGPLLLLCMLNGSFYAVLLRSRGWAQAVAGVPLHALHHVVGAAAVPGTAILYVSERLRRQTDHGQDRPPRHPENS
jgi:glycosyl transferase family 2